MAACTNAQQVKADNSIHGDHVVHLTENEEFDNEYTIVPQSTGNEEEESQAAAQLVLGGKMMLHDGKKHNVFF